MESPAPSDISQMTVLFTTPSNPKEMKILFQMYHYADLQGKKQVPPYI